MMVDPAKGPFLFDTSAESWLTRTRDPAVRMWLHECALRDNMRISAATVLERVRGYALLWHGAAPDRREAIESERTAYLLGLKYVVPMDLSISAVAAEIAAALPHPPTPPKRGHQITEGRRERLVRWRFDAIISATALVTQLPLIHNNAEDFETIRKAIEVSPLRFPGLGPLELVRCTSLV